MNNMIEKDGDIMKPTKEKLADPKWWDTYAKDGNDKCYWDEKEGSVIFASDGDLYVYYELLAKRPEPEKWVPKVGEECEYWLKRDPDSRFKCKPKYVSEKMVVADCFITGQTIEQALFFYEAKFRPIKTEREVLIDILLSTHSMSEGVQADAILASFDLTKKDGE